MISPKPRARDLGIPFEGTPGPLNAITDVDCVTLGHVTLVSGEGKLIVGQGPVRTGLTAILPRGNAGCDRVFAGYFSLNGNGEMTGQPGRSCGTCIPIQEHLLPVVMHVPHERLLVTHWAKPKSSKHWWDLP